MAKVNREWGTDTPPTSMAYLPQVFTTYMGIGYVAWLSVFFLLAGCWSAVREKRALLLLCAAIILAPILMSLQGISVHTYDYARYLICSLPLLLIVMAAGIDWLARLVWMRGAAAITAWGLATLIVACWAPYVGPLLNPQTAPFLSGRRQAPKNQSEKGERSPNHLPLVRFFE
jgi:hypothetical protein